MTKVVPTATAADAAVCNTLVPPTVGCPAGAGAQIQVPADWSARVAAGQDVPGVTYVRVEVSGSLYVSDATQTALASAPSSALSAVDKSRAAALLATAQAAPVSGVVTVDKAALQAAFDAGQAASGTGTGT